MSFDLIEKYFKNLSDKQKDQFRKLELVYKEWNQNINVISRKDMDHFYERHVLHSLAIAKVIEFKSGTSVLDIGTGGGFPGVPLAIMFPEVQFTLVDSIGKKIKVVNEVTKILSIQNVKAIHERAENVNGKFDFIVSRAVTRFGKFLPWTKNKFKKEMINSFPNGIFYLKGGDLTEELKEVKYDYDVFELDNIFEEEFFETKKVVYVKMI